MYCEKCGEKISDYAVKCRYCSTNIMPNYEFLTERGILKDKAALEALYIATNQSAYFVAYSMTKDEAAAMDILHDSYIKAFANLESLTEPKKFKSWFQKIVANKCRDYFKRINPSFLADVYGEEFEGELPDDRGGSDPQQYSQDEDIKRTVRQIIEDLPEDQRLCIIMYYYDEMSVREIAEEIGVSENTVKSRLRLARNRIKAEIKRLEKRGYEFKAVVLGPILMQSMDSTDIRLLDGGQAFERIFDAVTSAAPRITEPSAQTTPNSNAYQVAQNAVEPHAGKALAGTARSAVKAKIIVAVICGTAVVAGTIAAVQLISNHNKVTPTISDSSISDDNNDTFTTDVSQETTTAVSTSLSSSTQRETTTTTTITTTVTSETAPPETNADGWRDSYRQIVNDYGSLTFDFAGGSSAPSELSYSLYDIDKDSVPELIFLALDSVTYKATVCKIYSWNEDGAYLIGDLQLYMGTIGEIPDSGQFAATSYYQYNGQYDFYSVDISDGNINDEIVETMILSEGDSADDGEHPYAKAYTQLEDITLISGDASMVSDNPTKYIDSWGTVEIETESTAEGSQDNMDWSKLKSDYPFVSDNGRAEDTAALNDLAITEAGGTVADLTMDNINSSVDNTIYKFRATINSEISEINGVYCMSYSTSEQQYIMLLGKSDSSTYEEVEQYAEQGMQITYYAVVIQKEDQYFISPIFAGSDENGYFLVRPTHEMSGYDLSDMEDMPDDAVIGTPIHS